MFCPALSRSAVLEGTRACAPPVSSEEGLRLSSPAISHRRNTSSRVEEPTGTGESMLSMRVPTALA